MVLNRSSTRARRSDGVFAQVGQAAAAEATARSTSARVASATVFSAAPVAGLKTGWLRPDVPATRTLSIKWAISVMVLLPSSLRARCYCGSEQPSAPSSRWCATAPSIREAAHGRRGARTSRAHLVAQQVEHSLRVEQTAQVRD